MYQNVSSLECGNSRVSPNMCQCFNDVKVNFENNSVLPMKKFPLLVLVRNAIEILQHFIIALLSVKWSLMGG